VFYIYKDILNGGSNTDNALEQEGNKEKLQSNLKELLNLGNLMNQMIMNQDISHSVRFYEYLFISDIEKYILLGQCYYNKVNL